MTYIPPIPSNEMERLLGLSEFDIDYSDYQETFKDLAKLAAKVTGTEISLVNLIDSLTQWSISNYGLEIDQMLREDSVCQYTIMESDHFEVSDLSIDDRFKNKFYVTGAPNVRYYYGVPLRVADGVIIGALCVLDRENVILNPEKIELLKIIADEIVSRLKTQRIIEKLRARVMEAKQTRKKVAHDIRGPIGGIIGLAQIIQDQGESNQMEEVLEFINLIHKSGNSILELAEEILDLDGEKGTQKAANLAESGGFNLQIFKDKLEKLYQPQALNKHIDFEVRISKQTDKISFSRNKLMQITGNLISNSMKFTPEGGSVIVDLDLTLAPEGSRLRITVSDSGVGMSQNAVYAILSGTASSTDGTSGEKGYGFGLTLVKHLVANLNGTMEITSVPGQGATFEIDLPQVVH